jgi:uncharacterized protein YkwD
MLFLRRSFALTLLTTFSVSAPLSGCSSGDPGETKSGGGGGEPAYEPLTLPPNVYSHGDPSPLEQGLLEQIQRARANPNAEGSLIVEDPEVQGAIQQFGVDKQQVVADFQSYAPVPPLAFDAKLAQSAKFHSDDMATVGFQEHDGSAGEHFYERIEDAGYKYSFCSENIFAYARSISECHAAFLIDWGNPDLGHRKTLLDIDGEKRDIGISIVEESGPNDVGPLVVTQDFGMPLKDSERFLVGVVYRDLNGNSFYDPGEGLGGYQVVPDVGDTYAVTSTSGGYAIPFPKQSGAMHVQVQHDGKALAQRDASLGDDNVKVDFVVE